MSFPPSSRSTSPASKYFWRRVNKSLSTPLGAFFFLATTNLICADEASDRAAIEAIGSLTTSPIVYQVDTTSGHDESSQVIDTLSPGDHKTIFLNSIDYQGSETRAHAWINIPASASPTNKVPAIVLVHGGGGKAFEDWVTQWSARGYAAISIDTEGNSQNAAGMKFRHAYSGPPRGGVYHDHAVDIGDQFMYHATSISVLANSLLRSLPFIDNSQVGIHGVSWGGVITSTAIGVDQRFAFAIPSYGCGHMWDAVGNWQNTIGNIDYYRAVWDPMLRLQNATMPIQWLSWPTDAPFNIDCQANSYNQAPGTEMVTLIPGMLHGHGATWLRADSYDFADSIVNTGSGWCTVQSSTITGDKVEVEFVSTRPLTGALLVYTNEMGSTTSMAWPEIAVDSLTETSPGIWNVVATLPEDALGWFVNVTAAGTRSGYRGDDIVYSSSRLKEIVTITPPAMIELRLPEGETTVTEDVSLEFTAINNLEVTTLEILNESHNGAFSLDDPSLYSWTQSSSLEVTFENAAAGLTGAEIATATLRISWVELDNVTINTVDIPLQASIIQPETFVYDISQHWSAKAPGTLDLVFIQEEAEVSLDEDAEISGLTVGQTTSTGILDINQGHSLTLLNALEIYSGSKIHVTDGVLNYFEPTLDIDGEIHVDGGTVNLDGANVLGGGKLKVTRGSLNFSGTSTVDLAEIEISGGSVNFNQSGGNTQSFFSRRGTSTMTIIGSDSTVNFGIFNLQPWVSTNPIVNFVFDEEGVSPIQTSSFMNLPQLTLQVDGSAYTGGPGEIILLEAANFATLGDVANYSASGFAASGLEATFQQDQVEDVVKLVLTINAVYNAWAATESLVDEDADFGADPDKDGVVNLLEFVFGSDPSLYEANTGISYESGTFQYSRNTNASGVINQVIQISTDLQNWDDYLVEESTPEINLTEGVEPLEEAVTITLPPEYLNTQACFCRLKVIFAE